MAVLNIPALIVDMIREIVYFVRFIVLAFLKLCEIFQEQCDVVLHYSLTDNKIDIKMACTQGLCYLAYSVGVVTLENSI